MRDLTVGWRQSVLIEGVTFNVRKGEIFVILGRSGSGKSTLLRYLIGLETPSRGEITILGLPAKRTTGGPPPYGVTFQSGALLASLTVADNVALPLEYWTHFPEEVVGSIVCAKLHVVGLRGADEKLPAELSGGMKNRAAIARALVLEPTLLFLDEPAAGLDPVSADDFDDLLLNLNRNLGVTVVLVSHELASIFHIASRVMVLDPDSRSVIAIGDPRELRDSSVDPRVRRFLRREATGSGA